VAVSIHTLSALALNGKVGGLTLSTKGFVILAFWASILTRFTVSFAYTSIALGTNIAHLSIERFTSLTFFMASLTFLIGSV
jgi:hypothetical protein